MQVIQALPDQLKVLTLCRYHSILFPVTAFVCEMLPEGSRESSRAELFFEDLEKMAPSDVARICEWLTERVDSFSAKLKPEAKELLEVCLLAAAAADFACRCIVQACAGGGVQLCCAEHMRAA